MALPLSDDFTNRELSIEKLGAISVGLILTQGPNPPIGGASHGQPPHQLPNLLTLLPHSPILFFSSLGLF
jgi:hypothetical protein